MTYRTDIIFPESDLCLVFRNISGFRMILVDSMNRVMHGNTPENFTEILSSVYVELLTGPIDTQIQ